MCHLLFIYLRKSEKEEVNTHRENQAIHFPISDHEPNPFYRRLSSVSCKGLRIAAMKRWQTRPMHFIKVSLNHEG